MNIWFGCVVRGDLARITFGPRVNLQDGCVVHTDHDAPLTVEEGVVVGHRALLHGKRVGRDPRALYAQLGKVARHRFEGWTVALLVADVGAARASGLPLHPQLRTVNGGIPVHLLVGRVPVRSAYAHGHRRRAGDRRPAP